MANVIASYAAKKVLGKQMDKYRSKAVAGDDDPYFAIVKDRHGKPKKVKKQIPAYIPEHDAHVLAKAKSRAYHLDCSLFSLFGVRFGWSSVIGFIPEIGDVIDLYMAYELVERCKKVDGGLPPAVLNRMWTNVALDFFVGLIPFLGDLLDAAFRSNTKNVALLEKYLKEKYGPTDKAERDRSGLEAFADDVDPPPYIAHDSSNQHNYGTATMDGANGRHAAPAPGRSHTAQTQTQARTQPPTTTAQSQEGRGWFSFMGRGRQPDAENQQTTGSVRI